VSSGDEGEKGRVFPGGAWCRSLVFIPESGKERQATEEIEGSGKAGGGRQESSLAKGNIAVQKKPQILIVREQNLQIRIDRLTHKAQNKRKGKEKGRLKKERSRSIRE